MSNFRLLYIFYFITFISYGQIAPRQEIRGKLLPATKNLNLETIYVYNKQSKKGVLSDSLGYFNLTMRIGDTIIASAMQIETSELVIKQMHLNDKFITLPIHANMEYLEEVRLSNRSLTGNLDLDLRLLPTEPVVTSSDLGFPETQNDMTKSERLLSSYTSSPIELLMATLTGELKQIKQRIAIENREKKRQYVIKRMPSHFYTKTLKMASINIPHFIDFCESEKELDELIRIPIDEFVEFLQKTAIVYKDNYPDRF